MMGKLIKINPSQYHCDRYQVLLKADWTEKTIFDTVDLARRLVTTSGWFLVFQWEKDNSKKNRKYSIPHAASDYLREYLNRSNSGQAPEISDELDDPTQRAKIQKVQLAYIISVLVTLQHRDIIEDNSDLFRNIQSLLYLQSVEVLLPSLANLELTSSHNFLINALFDHARKVWVDEPAHENFLLCKYFEYVGQKPLVYKLMEASLNNTSVSDHEFITKVQLLWSYYLEDGHYDRAKELIMRMYRKASEKDLPELMELIELTIAKRQKFMKPSKSA